MKTLTIGSPCYNEEDSLPEYFEVVDGIKRQLAAEGWTVTHIVVNDGSKDRSGEILDARAAMDPTLTVVHHPVNMGYGAAMKTAFSLTESELLAFCDTDSNYDQRLILKLLERLGDDVDVINVSILAPGGQLGFPWHRKLLSHSTAALYRIFFPLLTRGIYTMTCGFRLYRTQVLPDLMTEADGFYATSESLLRALVAGARVVDFAATNADRRHGVSKMRFVRNAISHLRLILRARLGLLPPPAAMEGHRHRIGRPSS